MFGKTMAIAAAAALMCAGAASAGAAEPRITDPFYSYTGSTPLAQIAPGTVLKKRTVPYHLGDLTLPFTAQQLLYRSTSVTGKPTVNVTSIVRPLDTSGPSKLVGYGSFYDSLDPRDQPSMAIAGNSNQTVGGALPNVEALLVLPLLSAGYTVSIADTEGQQAAFAAGPEYGMNTLDGLRAAINTPETGTTANTKIGLLGYSGGAIATEWAAELAPDYAPDVNARLVGATMGGVLVDPDHNLRYINGSQVWAGVMPMALVGISRAFDIDLTPYMNDYGKQLFEQKQYASIVDALFQYPGLTFAKLTKGRYSTPESIPAYVEVANQLIMGQHHTPTAPLQIFQGAGGTAEGTKGDVPGIGPGDGVMVAGDVRALALKYCAKGVKVEHTELPNLSHIGSTGEWIPSALAWMNARFAGTPAPENCSSIAPGNSLEPLKLKVDPPPVVDPPAAPPEPKPPVQTPIGTPDAVVKTPSAPVKDAGGVVTPTVKTAKGSVRTVKVRGRTIIVTLACSGAETTTCVLKSKATTRNGRAIGTQAVIIRGGDKTTVTIRLNALGKRLVRKGKLKITVTTIQAASGNTPRILARTARTLR